VRPVRRIYTVPPGRPFLTALAKALLAGNLPIPGGVRPAPMQLADVTLLLPTRRATRALQEAFLAAGGGGAMLLPKIRPIIGSGEEPTLFTSALEFAGGVGEAAPANDGPTRRRQLASNAAAQAALAPLYWELDAEQKRLSAGGAFDPRRLSVEARWALVTPARDLDVVGHLLARFVRFDYRLMTHHHRRIVRAEWGRYSEAKRRYLEATYPYITQGFVNKPETTPAIETNVGTPAPA